MELLCFVTDLHVSDYTTLSVVRQEAYCWKVVDKQMYVYTNMLTNTCILHVHPS